MKEYLHIVEKQNSNFRINQQIYILIIDFKSHNILLQNYMFFTKKERKEEI